jgi:hypothetical protein
MTSQATPRGYHPGPQRGEVLGTEPKLGAPVEHIEVKYSYLHPCLLVFGEGIMQYSGCIENRSHLCITSTTTIRSIL